METKADSSENNNRNTGLVHYGSFMLLFANFIFIFAKILAENIVSYLNRWCSVLLSTYKGKQWMEGISPIAIINETINHATLTKSVIHYGKIIIVTNLLLEFVKELAHIAYSKVERRMESENVNKDDDINKTDDTKQSNAEEPTALKYLPQQCSENTTATSNDVAPLDMREYQNRLNTFTNWPLEFLTPHTLAINGFYYLGRGDETRCAFCKVEIMMWEVGDDPAIDHARWAPQCPFLKTSAPDSTSSACQMPSPANPMYATMASRLKSFQDWPISLAQKPEDLAAAGFFYKGVGDKTNCFYCDGGLNHWERDDVPWEQHARWFDRCAFLHYTKGPSYIQRVATKFSTIQSSDKDEFKKETDVKTAKCDDDHKDAVSDSKLCKICYVNESNVALIPCGHVFCASCSLIGTTCSICREPINRIQRLFYV